MKGKLRYLERKVVIKPLLKRARDYRVSRRRRQGWWERNGASIISLILDNDNAARYYHIVIKSFAAKETEKLFRRERTIRLPVDIRCAALRKLLVLDAAERVEDLRIPPGNRLEKLAGDRLGQWSIRINDQWRICFHWSDGDADNVEIVDYH
jgi:toxin HigB-1